MRQSSEIAARFLAIDTFLSRHQDFWRPRPFHGDSLPWTQQAPELAAWLTAKSLDWVDENEDRAAELPDCPELLSTLHAESHALCALPTLGGSEAPIQTRLNRGVPGRKLAQIHAFAQVALPRLNSPVICDWCGGKAHLSRTLAKLTGVQVHNYEQNAILCEHATSLAEAQGVQLHAHPVDVRRLGFRLPRDATLVALHACGDLSDLALATAHRDGLNTLMVAPCCHHKRRTRRYEGRSRLAQAQSALLELEESDLRLSTARVVVATQRMQRIRKNKMLYRAAYRRLIPGTFRAGPESWFTGSFSEFCGRISEREGHEVPAFDSVGLLAQAQEEVRLARAMGMVRAPFRRPLELWLNLDRARMMEEAGWTVELARFCSESVSPRDILIHARRGP